MATWGEVKARVEALIRRPLDSDEATADALVEAALSGVVKDLQRRHNFSCMEAVLALATQAAVEYVALGDAYKRMASSKAQEGCVYRLDATSRVLLPQVRNGEAVSLAMLRTLYPDPTDPGEPAYCCVYGRSLYFGPVPDAAYGIEALCYCYLAALTDAQSNWFTTALDDVLTWEGVQLARIMLDEPEGAAVWAGVSGQTLAAAIGADEGEKATRTGPRSPVVRRA
jgi:hypothetical protein